MCTIAFYTSYAKSKKLLAGKVVRISNPRALDSRAVLCTQEDPKFRHSESEHKVKMASSQIDP